MSLRSGASHTERLQKQKNGDARVAGDLFFSSHTRTQEPRTHGHVAVGEVKQHEWVTDVGGLSFGICWAGTTHTLQRTDATTVTTE